METRPRPRWLVSDGTEVRGDWSDKRQYWGAWSQTTLTTATLAAMAAAAWSIATPAYISTHKHHSGGSSIYKPNGRGIHLTNRM